MATTWVPCCSTTCCSDRTIRRATDGRVDLAGPGVLAAPVAPADAAVLDCPQDGKISADWMQRTGDPDTGLARLALLTGAPARRHDAGQGTSPSHSAGARAGESLSTSDRAYCHDSNDASEGGRL